MIVFSFLLTLSFSSHSLSLSLSNILTTEQVAQKRFSPGEAYAGTVYKIKHPEKFPGYQYPQPTSKFILHQVFSWENEKKNYVFLKKCFLLQQLQKRQK